MKVTLNTDNNYIKSIDIKCSTSEYLIIAKALRYFANDYDENAVDPEKARRMLKPEWYEHKPPTSADSQQNGTYSES